MMKWKNHFIILKVIILILIMINISFKYNEHLLIMISLLSLSILVIINDYMRYTKFNDNTKKIYISLSLSIFAALILQFFLSEITTSIYSYCFLFEIFQLEESVLKIFLSIHAVLYPMIYVINDKISDKANIFSSLGIVLLAYLGTSLGLYYHKTLEIEKEEIKLLNEKLNSANIKLQEYALEIEEVTISKERTRVAQELHDSLGHSLMALAMHLEFAKKICTTKPLKVEEVLSQSEKIAKGSINDLRKAVTLLNSEVEIKDLNTSLEKLISNFYLVSNLNIDYIKSKNINSLSGIIKTSIYKTIQESITNSLKHGNATEINIKISTANSNVEVVITDNGIGCNNIIKSNGLTGIENRISSLGGNTYYFSHNDLGFGIRLCIPV